MYKLDLMMRDLADDSVLDGHEHERPPPPPSCARPEGFLSGGGREMIKLRGPYRLPLHAMHPARVCQRGLVWAAPCCSEHYSGLTSPG